MQTLALGEVSQGSRNLSVKEGANLCKFQQDCEKQLEKQAFVNGN